MKQYTKIAQIIQLRTKLLPEVFEGNPTVANITGSRALRTVQWGNDVYMVANFSAVENQIATLPDGTWYNYFTQQLQPVGDVTLQPGEMLLLTGKQLQLPNINTDVENVYIPELPNQILPPYNVTIYTISGQAVSVQRNVEQVNLSGFNHGLYLIQLEKNGQRVTKKVIR
jgi:hypothetical protein